MSAGKNGKNGNGTLSYGSTNKQCVNLAVFELGFDKSLFGFYGSTLRVCQVGSGEKIASNRTFWEEADLIGPLGVYGRVVHGERLLLLHESIERRHPVGCVALLALHGEEEQGRAEGDLCLVLLGTRFIVGGRSWPQGSLVTRLCMESSLTQKVTQW
uniref:Uncharacterized protein n=1 Tax=Steinernema glaseri TaxID=37863 RepID=A0A1I7ZNP4_9BILA